MIMADAKQTLSNRLTKLHRRMEEAQVDAYLVLSSDAQTSMCPNIRAAGRPSPGSRAPPATSWSARMGAICS